MTSRSVVDIAKLERDIDMVETPEEVRRFAPARHRTEVPLPSYVQHQDGVGQLGALSAAAVVSLFESAAKDIDAMGTELKAAAQQCEARLLQLHGMIEEVNATAKTYRAEGKRIFEQVESYDKVTQQVAQTCEAMRNRIVAAVNAG